MYDFWLTTTAKAEISRASSEGAGMVLVSSLTREELHGLRAKLVREYIVAKHNREQRLDKPWEIGVPEVPERKRGRSADPEIAKRNVAIIKMFEAGQTVEEVCAGSQT